MSNNYNEAIRDQIEMQVLGANYSVEDLLDELQMSYQEAYEEKFVYDDLIDLVIEKRFDESPQLWVDVNYVKNKLMKGQRKTK